MEEKIELKDIDLFVRIARTGSLSKTAQQFNIPKASLSHSLRRLEDSLNVELFIRSARGLSLTEAGRAYLKNCHRIFESCDLAAYAAQSAHSSVSGKIRIAASAEFGTSILGAATLHLAREHPELDFEVRMYPSDVLLTAQPEFDCLIYVGTVPDSSYLCRKMGTISYGIYASPSFLNTHGTPKLPKDIKALSGVEFSRGGISEAWLLNLKNHAQPIDYQRKFSVNDYWMAKYYAVLGLALAYLPDFFVHYEVLNGALRPVLPHARSVETAAWVVFPMSRHKNPRVQLAVDTLCSKFQEFIVHPGYTLIEP